MAFKNSLELHHNFVKLAEESGFTFNTLRPRHRVDWNKFRLVDVDNLIRERKFVLIEQHANDILDCALESEFDVRILDEGFVKMFRLAQLTIEYQQFCRHYLDKSVYVLRDELSSVMQQLEATRKDFREKDEQVKKLKRKPKHNFRPPLMYGNDNIANLILKTLSNNGEMLPTTSLFDLSHQYNRCNYCDKVFLNQLYLKSHMARRHANVTEIPQKDSPRKDLENDVQSDKVNEEIMELKSKLKEMETFITDMNKLKTLTVDTGIQSNLEESENKSITGTQEPETLATVETNILEKRLDAWKKEERDQYTKEIDSLRSEIRNSIKSLKETPNINQNESILIEQLQQIIKDQGQQIAVLTREISENNIKAEIEKAEKSSQIEAQLRQWMQKVNVQTEQHELLVQSLNDITKQAQEARAAAETERYRAVQLEALFGERSGQHERKESRSHQVRDVPDKTVRRTKQRSIRREENIDDLQTKTIPNNDHDPAKGKSKLTPQRKTLDELHQKAQELLNMKSSSSSDESNSTEQNYSPMKSIKNKNKEINGGKYIRKNYEIEHEVYTRNKNKESKVNHPKDKIKTTQKKNNEESKQIFNQIDNQGNGPVIPRSPVKVVRAKLTEEVNNRLVIAGVDPLKNGLHPADYNKQIMQLQQEQRLKAKKNPEFDKVRNSIQAFLDSKAGVESNHPIEYSSETFHRTKLTKAFSLTSVISNVKNKALSLMKPNDVIKKERQASSSNVAKKAIALLKTPPGSSHSSPVKTRQIYNETDNNRDTMFTRKSIPSCNKLKKETVKSQKHEAATHGTNEDFSDTSSSDHKYYDSASLTKSAKSIENLMKSPVRRPSTANGNYNIYDRKEVTDKSLLNNKSHSVSDVSALNEEKIKIGNEIHGSTKKHVVMEAVNVETMKNNIDDNIQMSPKQAKGVLKNAPSANSLHKKKVLFDLDAIQMKSVSASPSQSTEKSDTNEKYELGLINLDDDEWDISSIDNEPLKENDHEIKPKLPRGTSQKIAELKHTIETQLAHRKATQSFPPVGGIDILKGPVTKVASIGGSNTTLGSSVFDDDPVPSPSHNTSIKPKLTHTEKDDSELDLSDFSIDGLTGGKRDSF